ncbi:MAG: diaminopimelate decarboxylase [Methylohalobius sp.]|nr:diaminopimelate decarboxylase [Methylohalobius sp.]
MEAFYYRLGQLHAEQVPVAEIVARYGTPVYVYSRAALEHNWRAFDQAFGAYPHRICYAVKANSNLAVLNLLARLGSGFDIVSGGELERVLKAGGQADRIVFSGVGKREDELRRALEVGIACFNVEVAEELDCLDRIARALKVKAPVSLRVNPDVDAKTHPYIATGLKENKFGIAMGSALDEYLRAADLPGLEIVGISCHIGSQLTELSPFLDALDKVLVLAERLEAAGITLRHLDLGGGLGICYRDEAPPEPAEYVAAILQKLAGRFYEIWLEPGRAIAGNAGILVTRVEYLKATPTKNFAIVDAGMNDLLRPSLYQAWQEIVPIRLRHDVPPRVYDIVGPVCESGDFLGRERSLALVPRDLLAVRSAGAYGFSMSSNYNSRPRPAEVLVDGHRVYLVRRREAIEDLWRGEEVPGCA